MQAEQPTDPQQQAQYLLYNDDLTGIYNRRFYNQAYPEQTHRAATEGTPMGFILIDVDFFKSINDRYGHQSGDAVLAGVGSVIRDAVGPEGFAVRYAGDEFVVLMPGLDRDASTAVAHRLSQKVREYPFKLVNNDKQIKMTFSVGVAHYPTDTDTASKLFENADHAAYIAKKQGRDRVINYQAGVAPVLDASTLYQYFPCAKFIGRGELLQELIEFLLAPAGEARPWVILGGDPGVGKTRLLQELRNRVDQQRSVLLETVGLPPRSSQPYGLITDLLGKYLRENTQVSQQVAGILEADELATIAPILPELSRHLILGTQSDGARDVSHADPVQAFCKILNLLAQNKPLNLLVDDFHLVDQQSMRVLEKLRTVNPNIFICAASRADEDTLEKNGVLSEFLNYVSEQGIAECLMLPEFTVDEVQLLIETVIPDAASFKYLGVLIHEKSRGVALMVEEILKLLIHSKAIRYEGPTLVVDVSADQIPTDADALVEVRAGQIDEDVRELLEHAAVIGSEFTLASLKIIEQRDEAYLQGMLDRARKYHVVNEAGPHEAGRIRFVSAHTHAAFYRAVDEPVRRALHLRLARNLEQQYAAQLDSALSELAFHFNRAGEQERSQQYRKMVSALYSQVIGEGATPADLESEDVKQAMGVHSDLSDEQLLQAVDALSSLKVAMQKYRMYGAGHLSKNNLYHKLLDSFAPLLNKVKKLTYSEAEKTLLINGQMLPQKLNYASSTVDALLTHELRALTFIDGIVVHDLQVLIELLGRPKEEVRAEGGIGKLLAQAAIKHIVPNDKVYVMVGQRDIVLKRANTHEEIIIKDVAPEAAPSPNSPRDAYANTPAAAAQAGFTADANQAGTRFGPGLPGAAPGVSPSIPGVSGGGPAASQELEQWRRELSRYVDLGMFDALKRNWKVLERDLESGNQIKILAASKLYVESGHASIEPLLDLIRDTWDERARLVAASLLGRISRDACGLVLQRLFGAHRAAEVCGYLSALQSFREQELPGEINVFAHHAERSVRLALYGLLARADRTRLYEVLHATLQHEDEAVRLDAIQMAGEHQVTECTTEIAELLQRSSFFGAEASAGLQSAACLALGRLGDPASLPLLVEVLDRGTRLRRARPASVRAAAASGLATLADATTRPRLLAELQKYERDAEEQVAAAVIQALNVVRNAPAERRVASPLPSSADRPTRSMPASTPDTHTLKWRGTLQ